MNEDDNMVGDTIIDPSKPVIKVDLPNMRELELLGRALKLLDKGCVRYSDKNFEDEREKLSRDIEQFFIDGLTEIVAPAQKPVVRLPVIK